MQTYRLLGLDKESRRKLEDDFDFMNSYDIHNISSVINTSEFLQFNTESGSLSKIFRIAGCCAANRSAPKILELKTVWKKADTASMKFEKENKIRKFRCNFSKEDEMARLACFLSRLMVMEGMEISFLKDGNSLIIASRSNIALEIAFLGKEIEEETKEWVEVNR